MLIGMLVKPFASPSITYMSEPTITTIVMTTSRNTVIFRPLARIACASTFDSRRYSESLSTRKIRSIRNSRIARRRLRARHEHAEVGRDYGEEVDDPEEASGIPQRLAHGHQPEGVLDREQHGECPLQGTERGPGLDPHRGHALEHHDERAAQDGDQQPQIEQPTRPGCRTRR